MGVVFEYLKIKLLANIFSGLNLQFDFHLILKVFKFFIHVLFLLFSWVQGLEGLFWTRKLDVLVSIAYFHQCLNDSMICYYLSLFNPFSFSINFSLNLIKSRLHIDYLQAAINFILLSPFLMEAAIFLLPRYYYFIFSFSNCKSVVRLLFKSESSYSHESPYLTVFWV